VVVAIQHAEVLLAIERPRPLIAALCPVLGGRGRRGQGQCNKGRSQNSVASHGRNLLSRNQVIARSVPTSRHFQENAASAWNNEPYQPKSRITGTGLARPGEEEDDMPDQETLERAQRDKREGKSASTQAGEF